MKQYPCINTWCDRLTDKPNCECDACKQRTKTLQENSWQWQGWSRRDERDELQKHHNKAAK